MDMQPVSICGLTKKSGAGDDQPEQQVEQDAWNAARQQSDEKCQAKPERADPKELPESSANTEEDTVAAGTA
jgi:hypothetical protein